MQKNILKSKSDNKHTFLFNSIIVDNDCFYLFINKIKMINLKNSAIFSYRKHNGLVEKLLDEFKANNISPEVYYFEELTANVNSLIKIKDSHKNIIVIGDENLISIAKYYSEENNSKIFVFLIGDFLDYSFSKFARLKKDDFYYFYLTKEPELIYVDCKYNQFNVNHVYYVLSKYIALIDSLVGKVIYQECENEAYKFIEKSLVNYVRNFSNNLEAQNINNIWMLIRLGKAISYFNQTKSFFGGDRFFKDLLQIKNKNISDLELSYLSLNLIKEIYINFFGSQLQKIKININDVVEKCREYLNLEYLTVLNRISKTKFLLRNKNTEMNYNAYYFYLKSQLLKYFKIINDVINKVDLKAKCEYLKINKNSIKYSLFFAPCLSYYPTTLNLVFAYGYLSKLI